MSYIRERELTVPAVNTIQQKGRYNSPAGEIEGLVLHVWSPGVRWLLLLSSEGVKAATLKSTQISEGDTK